MPSPPSALKSFGRAWRLLCPACGKGPLFRGGFAMAEACTACGRRFSRDEGHWLGGAEVHMFLTFGASAVVAFPLVLLFDLPPSAVGALVAGHLALSLGLYRRSRAIFVSLDALLDPPAEGPRGPRDPLDRPDGRPEPPRAPGPGVRRTRATVPA